jgi:hypothetical protein
VTDLASAVVGHQPVQLRDLLGSKPGLDRQEEDESVSFRVSRGGEITEHRIDLAVAQRLGLFPNGNFVLLSVIYGQQDAGL